MSAQTTAGVYLNTPVAVELWDSPIDRAAVWSHLYRHLQGEAEDRGLRILGPVLVRLVDPETLRPAPIDSAGMVNRYGMVMVRLDAPVVETGRYHSDG